MFNSNFTHTDLNGQSHFKVSKCSTCGLLHPDCSKESRGAVRGATSLDTIGICSEVRQGIGSDFEGYRFKLDTCRKRFMCFHNLTTKQKCAIPVSCDDRFCERCARSRAFRARILLNALILENDLEKKVHRLKFITLTVKNFLFEQLEWGLDHFFKWFKRLRERKIWKDNISGYFYGFEVTRSFDGSYHLHLHLIAEGSFIAQRKLSETWGKIVSKEWRGFIVDIREVVNIRKALKEVSKYCFKPATLDLKEKFLLSNKLKHRKLYGFGGAWLKDLNGLSYDDFIEEDLLIKEITKTWVFEGFISKTEIDSWDEWVFDSSKGLYWYRPKLKV